MKTLNLNKQTKGYYSKKVGNIEVIVSNGVNSKGWQFIINDYSKELEEFELINEWFNTKKDAYTFGADWIAKYL